MKRRFDAMSVQRPSTVEEVREWLRRLELFEQVNWNLDIPPYGALTHLLDDDFVWDWSPTSEAQYEAVANLTGVFHVRPEDRPLRPPQMQVEALGARTSSSSSSVGRPPSVVPTGSDSEEDSKTCSCDDIECDLHGEARALEDDGSD